MCSSQSKRCRTSGGERVMTPRPANGKYLRASCHCPPQVTRRHAPPFNLRSVAACPSRANLHARPAPAIDLRQGHATRGYTVRREFRRSKFAPWAESHAGPRPRSGQGLRRSRMAGVARSNYRCRGALSVCCQGLGPTAFILAPGTTRQASTARRGSTLKR